MTNPRRDDPTQISLPPGAIAVLPRGDDMWEFDYPRLTQTIYDLFHGAIDAGGAGDRAYAEDRYRQLLSDYPEFIDVYHHLAMLLKEVGEEDEAYNLWQRAVGLGLEHVPEAVRSGPGTLPWLMLDNRPFLRAYHGLGLEILERGQVEQALGMFLRLLDWNPNDNQGIRALAVDGYFRMGRPEGVLEICGRFPGDGMEELVYGRPVALYQLGDVDRAREALTEAIEYLPLVAQELVKKSHRRPKGLPHDVVTLWSPEQAYLYWKEHGRYWKKTPGVLDLLREMLGAVP